jgi:hypothetical protein
MSDPAVHKHRCMRCHEEFDCQTPGVCVAQYDVLPSIVTLGTDGQPKITEHCPHLAPKPDAVKTEAHTHCWHSGGLTLTYASYPPQHDEKCCHCGATRRVMQAEQPIPTGHGPYYPRTFGTVTFT